MKFRLHNLPVPYDTDPKKLLPRLITDRLGELSKNIKQFQISRRSIDARQRQVKLIFSVDIELENINKLVDLASLNLRESPESGEMHVDSGTTQLHSRPVVVGAGPAGLFAALLLAEHGYRPILLERGGNVEERLCALKALSQTRSPNPECNALFGLGGAGTFSDGKLRTGVNHPWLKNVLDLFVACGAPKEILIDAKPHVGTDKLRRVVENLAQRIKKLGGEIHFNNAVTGINSIKRNLCGLTTSQSDLPCEVAVLAIGHSARDTWQHLQRDGLTLAPKPFQLGIRVEHDQRWIDRHRYGKAAGYPTLGAADYKLATKVEGTPVFSFCMCPGGQTIPTVNEANHLAINGMSKSDRASPYSSSGLVVTLDPEAYGGDSLRSCLAFQRIVEHACFVAGGTTYDAPAQRLEDFAKGVLSSRLPKSSYPLGTVSTNLPDVLPPFVARPLQKALPAFNNRINGYLTNDALALAPESRASSPIRIVRDSKSLQSPDVAGVYPVGEGAGYAGGIMSAALDGLNAAKKIISTYAPPK